MTRGSFATMKIQSDVTEVTFYFESGHSESYKLPLSPQEFQQKFQEMLSLPWLTFNLIDQTVVICTNKLIKIEIKPGLAELQGENIYSAERVTSLQRATAGRLGNPS